MSLARKGLLVSAGAYATMAVQIVQAMVLSRALGPDGVGQMTIFRTTFVLGYQIASLGLPMAMIHEMNKGSLPPYKVLTNVIRCVMVMTVAAVSFLALLMAFWPSLFGEVPWPIYLALALFVPCSLLKNTFINYNAVHLDAWRLTAITFTPPLLLNIFYLSTWLTTGINVKWAMLSEAVLLGIFAVVLSYGLSRRSIATIRPETPDRSGGLFGIDWGFIRSLIPFGLQLAATDFLILANGYVVLVILKLTADATQVGYYSRGLRLGTFTILAVQGVQRLLYSNWSKLDGAKLLRSVERVVNACTILVIFLSAFVIVAARPLTLFLFGRDFLPAVPITRITLLGLCGYMIVYLLQSFFNSLRKGSYNIMVLGAGVVVNFVAGLLLIPRGESIGAACAVTCGYLAMMLVAVYLGRRRCGLGLRAMFVPSPSVLRGMVRSLKGRREDPTRGPEADDPKD